MAKKSVARAHRKKSMYSKAIFGHFAHFAAPSSAYVALFALTCALVHVREITEFKAFSRPKMAQIRHFGPWKGPLNKAP